MDATSRCRSTWQKEAALPRERILATERIKAALFRLILRIFRLFANSGEQFVDSRRTDGVGKERRPGDAAVGENGIGRACFTLTGRLDQPGTVAYFHPKNAGLLCRSMFVGWLPAIEISQSIFNRPRFLLYAKRVIAIAHDFWGDPLISENGISFSLDDATLRRVGHETRITFDIIDNLVNRLGRCVDFAYRFELFQVRPSVWPAVNHYAVALFNCFPIRVGARFGREDRQRSSGKKGDDRDSPFHSYLDVPTPSRIRQNRREIRGSAQRKIESAG